MRKSCGACRRSNSLSSRVRQSSSRKTPVGQQPHDAAPDTLCGSFPASMQETPSGLAKGLSVAPAQESMAPPQIPSPSESLDSQQIGQRRDDAAAQETIRLQNPDHYGITASA